MPKQVLDVGNCGPDHAAIRHLIESNFDAVVLSAQSTADALSVLKQQTIDLVLVNRKLDIDYSDGLKVIQSIKADDQVGEVPVMMVTNFEEHQVLAQQAGAERGFGKLALQEQETISILERFLTTS